MTSAGQRTNHEVPHSNTNLRVPLAALIVAPVLGMTLALLGAPVAQADDASFVAAAHALGYQESPDCHLRSPRSRRR
jgi:hypothetical protein